MTETKAVSSNMDRVDGFRDCAYKLSQSRQQRNASIGVVTSRAQEVMQNRWNVVKMAIYMGMRAQMSMNIQHTCTLLPDMLPMPPRAQLLLPLHTELTFAGHPKTSDLEAEDLCSSSRMHIRRKFTEAAQIAFVMRCFPLLPSATEPITSKTPPALRLSGRNLTLAQLLAIRKAFRGNRSIRREASKSRMHRSTLSSHRCG